MYVSCCCGGGEDMWCGNLCSYAFLKFTDIWLRITSKPASLTLSYMYRVRVHTDVHVYIRAHYVCQQMQKGNGNKSVQNRRKSFLNQSILRLMVRSYNISITKCVYTLTNYTKQWHNVFYYCGFLLTFRLWTTNIIVIVITIFYTHVTPDHRKCSFQIICHLFRITTGTLLQFLNHTQFEAVKP